MQLIIVHASRADGSDQSGKWSKWELANVEWGLVKLVNNQNRDLSKWEIVEMGIGKSDMCFVLHITRYMICVACYMFVITFYVLRVMCNVIYVKRYILCVTCYILHATCYLQHVACYVLHFTCYT